MRNIAVFLAPVVLAGFVFRVSADTPTGADEVLAHVNGFSCEISGLADASKNIREIAIDELNIDVREMTTGLDVEYRQYRPGTPHFGEARLTVPAGSSASKELQAWFLESSKGKNIRKNLTVTLFKSDKSPGRKYNLIDCFPTQWSSVNFDSKSGVRTETLTVKIGRIEFMTRTAPPPPGSGGGTPPDHATKSTSDKFAQVRGFSVEIAGRSGKEVDTAWESVSGGELIIEHTETTIGSDKFSTFSPGHKTVSEITLRGAMTDKRALLCAMLNDAAAGKPWKQMLTITEMLSVDGGVKDGKRYQGVSPLPIRYRFPTLSVDRRDGNFEEEITFLWQRWEPDLPVSLHGLIEIPDAPVASRAAVAIGIEDMAMDVSLVPSTGDARTPSARLVLPVGSGAEIDAWLKNVEAGLDDRRTLSVTLFKQKKPSGQVLTLHDCVPVSKSVTGTTGNTREEVSIKFIRFEMQ